MPSEPTGAVLSFADARRCVEQHASELITAVSDSELLPILDSIGRVLAEEIVADREFPPFPRATRDGYAVVAQDLNSPPATLKVIGQVKAGAALPASIGPITPGTCVEIMTGAPVPVGADAVVMVEYTTRRADSVEITRGVKFGENIVPTGSEARLAQALLMRGTRINYPQIAVAASVGKASVKVFTKPQIAILSTGDEVVDITAQPGPYQIRNSNSFSLAAQVLASGGQPIQLAIAKDEKNHLCQLVKEGLKSDLLLLSGGVSMGKFDLVEEVLREFKAEIFFTGAKIQPGKPIVFGRISTTPKYFFGLPGNPTSTMVTFELFAKPLIDALGGAAPAPLIFTQAKLKTELKTKAGLRRFLPAMVSGDHTNPEVELVGWQGSGDIVSMARANCFLVVPPDKERISAGEHVSLLLR
jgi:molybdopterin molybdotransferase